MASAGQADTKEFGGRDVEDIRRSCSLCFEPYVGRVPKILPCFHTFCLSCLAILTESRKPTSESGDSTQKGNGDLTEEMTAEEDEKDEEFSEVGEEEKERDPEGVSGVENETLTVATVLAERGTSEEAAVFPCPACRKPFTVPEGGVSALQTNFYIVTEASEDRKPVLCDMCEDDDRKEATHMCDKCQQCMCQVCRRYHDKLVDLKEHQVMPVTVNAASMSKNEIKKCQFHRDHDLCLFCKDCDTSICLLCKVTQHQSHDTSDIEKALQSCKEGMRALVKVAKKQIQILRKSVARQAQDFKKVDRQRAAAIEEVMVRYDEIIRWLNRSRVEVVEAITTRADDVQASMKAEENSMYGTVETLAGLVSRTVPTAHYNPDVLLLKDELQAALLEDDVLGHYESMADGEEDKMVVCLKCDTSALDLEAVRTYLGQLSVTSNKEELYVRDDDDDDNFDRNYIAAKDWHM